MFLLLDHLDSRLSLCDPFSFRDKRKTTTIVVLRVVYSCLHGFMGVGRTRANVFVCLNVLHTTYISLLSSWQKILATSH